MDRAPNEPTACEAHAQIAVGSLTSEALVRACLRRIHPREPDLTAWANCNPELAIAQAKDRDAEGLKGGALSLAGSPVGFKDIMDTADMPTTYGSPFFVANSATLMGPAYGTAPPRKDG